MAKGSSDAPPAGQRDPDDTIPPNELLPAVPDGARLPSDEVTSEIRPLSEESAEYESAPTIPPPTGGYRREQRTRFGLDHAYVVPVRWSSVAILSLMFVLCVWIVISYLRWINDPYPTGVLSRSAAQSAAVAVVEAPRERPRRLFVVVIDGLRADTARRLPTLNALADRGADFEMDVGLPTYSRPVYAALSTGTRQDRNGIRSNSFSGAATVDSFWERAHAAGLRVDGVSNLGWWTELFPHAFRDFIVTTPAGLPDAAGDLFAGDAEVVLIHPTEVDFYGHEEGARSPRYGRAAEVIDRMIGRWISGADGGDGRRGRPAIDLEQDALFVLSDHGHRRRGGHGGPEPEVQWVRGVAAGVGIRPGSTASLRSDQIAPTLSILLGIEFPRDVEGAPVTSLLDGEVLGEDYVRARQFDWAAQTYAYLSALDARGPAHFDPADGFPGWRDGMAAERAEGRWIRLSLAAVGLTTGFVLILGLRRDPRLRIIPPALTFLALFLFAALLTDNATSLSAAEREHRYAVRLFAFSFFAFAGQMGAMRAFRVEDWDTVFMLGGWTTISSVVLTLAFYGIPLTAPLPPPALTFWPFFGTFLSAGQCGLGLLMLVLVGTAEHMRRSVRRRSLE